MRYYHGSNTRLEVGDVLTSRGANYESDWEHTDFYAVLEQHRPSHMLPHRDAVFMVGDPDDVDLAGGGTEWIFHLEPFGQVSKHDLNWSSEISCLISDGHAPDSDKVTTAALNYWSGIPHHNESVWEYLARSAKILQVGKFEDFEATADLPHP